MDENIAALYAITASSFAMSFFQFMKFLVEQKNGKSKKPESGSALAASIMALVSEIKLLRSDFQEHDKDSAISRTKIDHIHSKLT